MTRSWIAIGWIAFAALLFFHGRASIRADEPTDLYYVFFLSLSRGYPVVPLIYAGLFFIFVMIAVCLAIAARDVLLVKIPDAFFAILVGLGFIFLLVLILGASAGDRYEYNLQRGCPLRVEYSCSIFTRFRPISMSDPVYLLSPLYFLGWMLSLPAVVGIFVAGIPIWIAGYVTLTTTHPAANIVRRSGRTISQELATVLKTQLIDDEKAARLFHQMGPLRQLMWKAHYNKRREQSDRLRQTLEAQEQSLRADTALMRTSINRDRIREERYDR